MENETEKFIVGDVLTVVKTAPLAGNIIAPPLTMGEQREVVQIYTCGCGKDHIDVGVVSKYEYVSCYICEEHLPNGNEIHWCHPTRFKK